MRLSTEPGNARKSKIDAIHSVAAITITATMVGFGTIFWLAYITIAAGIATKATWIQTALKGVGKIVMKTSNMKVTPSKDAATSERRRLAPSASAGNVRHRAADAETMRTPARASHVGISTSLTPPNHPADPSDSTK